MRVPAATASLRMRVYERIKGIQSASTECIRKAKPADSSPRKEQGYEQESNFAKHGPLGKGR